MTEFADLDDAQRLRQTTERLVGLQAVTEALSKALTPEQVADAVIGHGVQALGARAGSLVLITPSADELEIVKTIGYALESVEPYRRFRLDAPLPLSDAARTGQPVYLEHWQQWVERYPNVLSDTQRTDHNDSWAAIPLRAAGRILGGIGLTFPGARAFSEDDKAFMTALARQCAQALERARLYAEAQTTAQRAAFLAEASAALSSSLDYQTTLSQLAALAVPRLADWCGVDIVGEDGEIDRLAVAHVDPAKSEWAKELRRRYPSDPNADRGVPQVLRTGRSTFAPFITDEQLADTARDSEHLAMLREIGFRSVMIVPLTARGRTLGALILVTSDESGRRFDESDLGFAEDLAGRAALAVDNARLYQNERAAERHKGATLAELEAMLAASPAGFAFIDAEYRFIRVSEMVARINGLPVQSHIGRFIWDVIGAEAWRHRQPFFQRALAGEEVLDIDLTASLPQNTPAQRALMASYFPVRQEGQIVGVGAVVTDVTERRRAEGAVRESEHRFRLVADTAPVMIWMTDADGGCIYLNKTRLEFVGRAMEQEQGEGWLGDVHPDDLMPCIAEAQAAAAECAPFEHEFRLRRADGEYRWLLNIGRPRLLPDGTFLGYIGSSIDITERREAEQALVENETRQRVLLKEILASVTEGKFRLCDTPAELPQRLAAVSQPIPLSLHSIRPIRTATQDAARAQGLSDERLNDLETAVGEAAMNAVVHGGSGIGEVCAERGLVQVWIQDTGGGIDVQRLPRATLQRGFTTAGTLGHGFWMMLQTADILWLLTGPTGTTVVIEQSRILPEPAWLHTDPPNETG